MHIDDWRGVGGDYATDMFDPENPEVDKGLERNIRHAFIKKVYGILLIQLSLTGILGAKFTLDHNWQHWILYQGGGFVVMGAAFVALAILLILVCVKDMTKKVPANYILLSIYTTCMAVSLGGACAVTSVNYGSDVVAQAFLASAGLVGGLTLFAFQSKYDFTSLYGFLYTCFIVLSIASLLFLFFPRIKWLDLIISSVFVLFFALYLIIDTQLIVGKGRVKIESDEYILAALMLYIDIVNIFLYLLRILSALRRND